MKTNIAIVYTICIIFLALSCKKKDPDPEPDATPAPAAGPCTPAIVTVTDDITTPTTWDACHIYIITSNAISVSSTHTIEPGTVIKFRDNVYDNAILVSGTGVISAQ